MIAVETAVTVCTMWIAVAASSGLGGAGVVLRPDLGSKRALMGTVGGVSWPSLPAPGTRGRFLAGHSLNIIPTSPNGAQADRRTHLTKPGLDLAPSLNKKGKGSCGGGWPQSSSTACGRQQCPRPMGMALLLAGELWASCLSPPRGSPPAPRVEIKPLNLVCLCRPLKENRHFSQVHVLGLNVKFLFRPYPQSSC